MRYITVLLAVLTLAACGGKTPVANTAPEPHTAGDIATAMSMGKVTVWTAETDPNKLLGRPGGYTSAATIVDKALTCTEVATDCGATVEVYPTDAEAKARSEYIQSMLGNGGVFGTEYHYFAGTALLRVTGQLTPDVAKQYAAKFEAAAKR
jgi:hypothetical protein